MMRGEAFEDEGVSALDAYHGHRALQVQGTVVSDPEAAGVATRFRFRVDRVRPGDQWEEISGEALVTLRESTELVRRRDRPYFRYGDQLLLTGTLGPPPELDDFDYPAYLARQGIGSVMSFPRATLLDEGHGALFYRWLYNVRRHVADSLAETLHEPQASMGQALLLGLRDNLPEDLVEDFRVTGTSHVLAISGLHVGILLIVSLAVSRRVLGLRRHLYLVLPFALMWPYALVSGMSPSVTRASIMGSVYLAALLLGRPRSVLPALGFAAAVMVALTPTVIESVSFQLSFAAMAGIALLSEPVSLRLQRAFGGRLERAGPLSPTLLSALYIVAMTVAATVVTLPLVAFYFHRVSLVGLPTTLLVLPALPAILLTQAATGILGLISTALAEPFSWLAWLTTTYVTGVVGLLGRIPSAAVETGDVAPWLVWAYYGVIVLLYAGASRATMWRRWLAAARDWPSALPYFNRPVPWLVLAPIVSVAALLWIAALSLPDSKLKVAFVDVGQGDAVFISTPGGQQIVVDGGPDPMRMVQFLGERMPFRDRTIDLVVLTHPHSDHVTGLIDVLRRYDVRVILEREVPYDSPSYQAWRQAVQGEEAQVVQAQAGQAITLDDDTIIQVLSPGDKLLRGTSSDVNNASVVLRLVYGNVGFLLSGDMFSEAERALVARDVLIDSDVLKVAHHGSRTSSSPDFLDSATPTPKQWRRCANGCPTTCCS